VQVRHGNNENFVAFVCVNHTVWKPGNSILSQFFIHLRPRGGKISYAVEGRRDFHQEVGYEAGSPRFVIANGLAKFCLS